MMLTLLILISILQMLLVGIIVYYPLPIKWIGRIGRTIYVTLPVTLSAVLIAMTWEMLS